jgi:hypothetical protein
MGILVFNPGKGTTHTAAGSVIVWYSPERDEMNSDTDHGSFLNEKNAKLREFMV